MDQESLEAISDALKALEIAVADRGSVIVGLSEQFAALQTVAEHASSIARDFSAMNGSVGRMSLHMGRELTSRRTSQGQGLGPGQYYRFNPFMGKVCLYYS